jgi:hypothetical protein
MLCIDKKMVYNVRVLFECPHFSFIYYSLACHKSRILLI